MTKFLSLFFSLLFLFSLFSIFCVVECEYVPVQSSPLFYYGHLTPQSPRDDREGSLKEIEERGKKEDNFHFSNRKRERKERGKGLREAWEEREREREEEETLFFQEKKIGERGEGVCLGKANGGRWEFCAFERGLIDTTKSVCGHIVCLLSDFSATPKNWGLLSSSSFSSSFKSFLPSFLSSSSSSSFSLKKGQSPICSSRLLMKQDALILDLKYTHRIFFHFVAQVMMKIFLGLSEYYATSAFHIVILGDQYTQLQLDWLQLFTKYPIQTEETIGKSITCFRKVFFVHLDDWFNGGFHLLHLEWKPQFPISPFVDYLHSKTGARSRVLIPSQTPLKVVYVWRDQDRSAKDRYNRRIMNQNELVEALRRKRDIDFQIAKMEEMSPKEQLTILRDTAILIGPHGSGLVNLIFLPRCAAVIEILPNQTDLKQHPAKTFVNVAHISGKMYHPYISSKKIDPGFPTIDIRKMSTEVVIDEFLIYLGDIVDSFLARCQETPFFGLQSVKMKRGTMKFAEQVDEEQNKMAQLSSLF